MAEFLPGDVVANDDRRGVVTSAATDVYVIWDGFDLQEGAYPAEELTLVERPEGIAWDLLRRYPKDRELYEAAHIHGVVREDNRLVDNWTATFPDGTYLSWIDPMGAFAHRLK
jgi:hypothetical protein